MGRGREIHSGDFIDHGHTTYDVISGYRSSENKSSALVLRNNQITDYVTLRVYLNVLRCADLILSLYWISDTGVLLYS